jgi:hypothetical protein
LINVRKPHKTVLAYFLHIKGKNEDKPRKERMKLKNNLVPNIPYTILIDNINADYRWIVEEGVTLARPKGR